LKRKKKIGISKDTTNPNFAFHFKKKSRKKMLFFDEVLLLGRVNLSFDFVYR